MKEKIITFETAKLAKEKGFDWKVNNSWDQDKDGDEFVLLYLVTKAPDVNWNSEEWYTKTPTCYSAPTQALLQKWLREEHDIRVLIDFETIDDSETAYVWNIVQDLPEGKGRKKDTWNFYNRLSSFSMERMEWYNTFEEALEKGLLAALKL
jgi:hypothetical protein